MARDYKRERSLVVERWYGSKWHSRNTNGDRMRSENTISPADGYGIPSPLNDPYPLAGHCLVWRYSLNSDGYGRQKVEGRNETAHRLAYEQTRGAIPDGMQVNHLCDRPYCFQPSHLYAGRQQDNSDDSKLFRYDKMFSRAVWTIAGLPYEGDDPLLQRLSRTLRYPDVEPWTPIEHPPQAAFIAFRCKHDFAIPQPGGDTYWCRICEETPETLKWGEESQEPALISELWPISQTVGEIWEAIYKSKFTGDLNADQRRSAYIRSSQTLGGTHRLSGCLCDLCVQDRRVFRSAIDESLTDEMRMSIHICDVLKQEIQRTLMGAAHHAMDLLAARSRIEDPALLRVLANHVESCSAQELSGHVQDIERMIGGATYAAVSNHPGDAVTEQLWYKMVSRWIVSGGVPKDVQRVIEPTLPTLEDLALRLIDRWKTAIAEETGGAAVIDQLAAAERILGVAYTGVAWQLLEQLR